MRWFVPTAENITLGTVVKLNLCHRPGSKVLMMGTGQYFYNTGTQVPFTNPRGWGANSHRGEGQKRVRDRSGL